MFQSKFIDSIAIDVYGQSKVPPYFPLSGLGRINPILTPVATGALPSPLRFQASWCPVNSFTVLKLCGIASPQSSFRRMPQSREALAAPTPSGGFHRDDTTGPQGILRDKRESPRLDGRRTNWRAWRDGFGSRSPEQEGSRPAQVRPTPGHA